MKEQNEKYIARCGFRSASGCFMPSKPCHYRYDFDIWKARLQEIENAREQLRAFAEGTI